MLPGPATTSLSSPVNLSLKITVLDSPKETVNIEDCGLIENSSSECSGRNESSPTYLFTRIEFRSYSRMNLDYPVRFEEELVWV